MITNLNHITLAVTDIDKSFAFYSDVLGFKPLVKWDAGLTSGGAYFLIGDLPNETWFCLNVDPNHISSMCYTHYAFSVLISDFDAMSERIVN